MSQLSKRTIPGSPANYWEIDAAILNNMQWTVTPVRPEIAIFRSPHACIEGTVAEVLHEDDGDTHFWLTLAGTTKDRLACEITPQNPLPHPQVGARVRVYGIYRYDAQHQWGELHPVDWVEVMP